MTPEEQEALAWVKANYRQWRKRLMTSPDALPPSYRHVYWHPFGVPAWNNYIHVARLWLERTTGWKYPREEEREK
jgi:hypothetical protein